MNNDVRTALLIAHPAHELLVYAWLETTKPTVHILTRGSSYSQPPRIGRSEQLLSKTGCGIGRIFGEIEDQALYQQLLEGVHHGLIDLTWKLTQALIDDRTEVVVGDAAEGQILAHDIWRAMINAAIDFAQTQTGRQIENLAFAIEITSSENPLFNPAVGSKLTLEESALDRKYQAIKEYIEVASEADRIFATQGRDLLAQETILPADPSAIWLRPLSSPTNYELHGEQQVRLGRYRHAIKHDQHVLPFVKKLENERLRLACA